VSFLLLALLAVQTPVDEGTLVVREDTAEVAREAFRLSSVRIGLGGTGWTLATTARYDRARPVVVLAPILEVTGDSQPSSLEFDVANPSDPVRILGQVSRGRFTVRLLRRRLERAREFPVTGRTVVLDDSVFALYLFAAWQAGPRPVEIAAIVPRSGRRETLTVQDHGVVATTLNRDPATLRHISVTGGPNLLVDVWLDESGRLFKIEIPSRRLRIERLPPA
jgi:hypothetical protein